MKLLLLVLLMTSAAGPPEGPPDVRVWLQSGDTYETVEGKGLYLFTDVHTATDPLSTFLRGRVDGELRRFDFEGLDGFEILKWTDHRRARVRFRPREGEPVVAEDVLIAPMGGLWGVRRGDLRTHGARIVAADFAPFGEIRPKPRLAPPADLDAPGSPLRTRIRSKDGAVMVWVPAGPFVMGHDEPGPGAPEYDDAAPAHLRELPGFWIDRTEVSVRQFRRFLAEKQPGQDREGEPRLPATGMTWVQAQEYCAWAGARLPSEAEWEKAARGGSTKKRLQEGREFPWGDVLPGHGGTWRANVRTLEGESDGYEGPAPVGSFPAGAGPYGTLDQAGNVREWVQDIYRADAYRPGEEQKKEQRGKPRFVMRGGSYLDRGDYVRTWFRMSSYSHLDLGSVGLRCATDAAGPAEEAGPESGGDRRP